MKIVICDDNEKYQANVLKLINEIITPNDRVYTFSHGNDLLDSLCKKRSYDCDLTILDLKMPGLTGLEVAHEIRRVAEDACIVILTRYGEFALDAYDVHPYDYIIKPVKKDKLTGIIDKVRSRLPRPETIVLRNGKDLYEFKIPLIYFIEVFGSTLHVHTTEGTYKCSGKISDVYSQLAPYNFFQIHKSIIINLAWIKYVNLENLYVTMEDNVKLQIAARRRGDFLDAYKYRGHT